MFSVSLCFFHMHVYILNIYARVYILGLKRYGPAFLSVFCIRLLIFHPTSFVFVIYATWLM